MGANREYKAVSNYLINTLRVDEIVRGIIKDIIKEEIEEVFKGWRGQCLVTEAILKGLGKTEFNVNSPRTTYDSKRSLVEKLNKIIGDIIVDKLDIQVKPKT